MNEDTWPAFVIDDETEPRRRAGCAQLTGWETVTFELDDADLQDWESAFSTAALAP